MIPILTTTRLRLRPMTAADAPCLFAILRDPLAMRFWDRPPIVRLAVVEEMVREQLEAMESGQCLYWTIWAEHDAIGGVDLSFIENGQAQFGFLLRADQWGRGFATEAIAAVTTYAFEELELDCLRARIHAANRAAARALEKSGFVLDELRPGYRLDSGAVVACEFYERFRPRQASKATNGR